MTEIITLPKLATQRSTARQPHIDPQLSAPIMQRLRQDVDFEVKEYFKEAFTELVSLYPQLY